MLKLRALKKSTAMLISIAMIVTLFAGLTMMTVSAADTEKIYNMSSLSEVPNKNGATLFDGAVEYKAAETGSFGDVDGVSISTPGGQRVALSQSIRTKGIEATVSLEAGETMVAYYRGADSSGAGKDISMVIKSGTQQVAAETNSERGSSNVFAIAYKASTAGKYTVMADNYGSIRTELYAIIVTPYDFRDPGAVEKTPPADITGLTATPDDGMVSLKWNPAAGATSYSVKIDNAAVAEDEETVTGLEETSYMAAGLQNGTEYTFTVWAVNDAGQSKPATTTATPVAPEVAPLAFTVSGTARDAAAAISWTQARYANTYDVYRDNKVVKADIPATTTSYVDEGLTNGQKYTYKVVAKNAHGNTDSSNTVDVTPVEPPPSSIKISYARGSMETAYVVWTNTAPVEKYNVYIVSEDGTETKLDDELVRYYGNYYRADAVGIKAGNYHFKITEIKNGAENTAEAAVSDTVPVIAHVREGFGFAGGIVPGAYNADGTPEKDATILYVDKNTANTISMDVITKNNKTEHRVGLANIMAARQKGVDKRPLIIRFIGRVDAADVDGLNSDNYIQVKGCYNVTLEGIGSDAVLYNWSFLVRDAHETEVRNFGVIGFKDDGISLDTDNDHIWVHNNDIFYGDPGGDADQAKGDGSLDVKGFSNNVTLSYNHFWDSGKCSLCGMGDSQEFFVSYHHNWFDHSDSRHPRIRVGTIHIYNNYFDGNSKYGVGVTMGSSAFVENNFFRNCYHPVLSSLQGTDALGDGTFSGEDGGMIKMFGNKIEGDHYVPVVDARNPISTGFDAYIATSRNEQVPSEYKTVAGGTTYNNFDTRSDMYKYNVQEADVARADVMAYAGRVDGGDYKYTFDNSVDDASYDVNTKLKSELKSYKSALVHSYTSPATYPATDGSAVEPAPTTGPIPTAGPTLKPGETAAPAPTAAPTQAPVMANPTTWDFGKAPFTVTEGDAAHPDTKYFPQNKDNTARYDIKSDSITPEHFGGLKHTVGSKPEGQYQTGSAEFEDGFKSSWQIKSNGGSFSFIPVVDGTVKVYAKHGSTDTTKPDDNVTITQGTNSQKLTIKPGDQAPFKVLTMDVVANQTVTISADQNTSYYCIAYTSDKPVPTTPPVNPTNPPAPTAPPADYDYSITGAAVNGSGLDVTVAYSGAAPAPEGVLLAAKYDDSEALTEFKQGPKVSGAGTYKIDGFTPKTGDKYWIYIWDSVDGMKPLCEKYVATTSVVPPEPTQQPAQPTQQPAQPGQEIMWTFTGEGTLSGTVDFGNGLTFKAGSGSEYAAGGEVDGITFPNRIKLGGKTTFKAGSEDRIFTYTPASDGTLTVYFMHASSSSGEPRNLQVDQNGTTILTAPVTIEGPVSASVAVKGGSAVTFGGQANMGIMGVKFVPAN